MFDLEQQISHWRQALSRREAILADDIAELEDQLLSSCGSIENELVW